MKTFLQHVVALLTAPMIILVVGFCGYSAKEAQSQPNITPSESAELSAREQELQRKEEELLRTMQGGGSAQGAPEAHNSDTITSQSDSAAIIRVDNVTEVPDYAAALHNERNQLHALEHHPALDAVRTKEPQRPSRSASSAVKTHTVESSPDGTTARRLGTYVRVGPEFERSGNLHRETAQAHTVSLHSIQQEASIRPVSYSFEEVATIRSGSTHLRTGPSRLDVNLMPLPQYSEVSIDYRDGSWYRVKTHRGLRGWVPGSSLLFDAGISPRSAVRIGAVK